jgi:hypothetical protein
MYGLLLVEGVSALFGERFFEWLGGRYGGKVVMFLALVFMIVAVVEYEGRK